MLTEADFQKSHPSVACLERLSELVKARPEFNPWLELSLERAIALCRGASSTAPIDCLLTSHALIASRERELPLLASIPNKFEFAARLCTGSENNTPGVCFLVRLQEGTDIRSAALACRATSARSSVPQNAQVAQDKKDAQKPRPEQGGGPSGNCGGIISSAVNQDVTNPCRGNDAPNALSCFRAAGRIRLSLPPHVPATILSSEQSALLCSLPR